MIKPEQVPEAAWQAASGLWFNGAKWPQIVAAALNAWEGMLADGDLASGENGPPLHLVNVIILPLPPQEASND